MSTLVRVSARKSGFDKLKTFVTPRWREVGLADHGREAQGSSDPLITKTFKKEVDARIDLMEAIRFDQVSHYPRTYIYLTSMYRVTYSLFLLFIYFINAIAVEDSLLFNEDSNPIPNDLDFSFTSPDLFSIPDTTTLDEPNWLSLTDVADPPFDNGANMLSFEEGDICLPPDDGVQLPSNIRARQSTCQPPHPDLRLELPTLDQLPSSSQTKKGVSNNLNRVFNVLTEPQSGLPSLGGGDSNDLCPDKFTFGSKIPVCDSGSWADTERPVLTSRHYTLYYIRICLLMFPSLFVEFSVSGC